MLFRSKRWDSIRSAYARLEAPVSPEDLAAATGLGIDEVLECLQSVRLTNPDSWHEELTQDGRSTGEGLSPEAVVEKEEELQMLADSIEQLPDQERTVLTLYHMEDLRLKEIGDTLGLSESRISRVLAAAEFRLKETVRRRVDCDGDHLQDRRFHSHDKHTADRTGVAGEPSAASRRGQGPHKSGTGRRVRS